MSNEDIESHTYLGCGGSSVVAKVRLSGERTFLARKQMQFEQREIGMLLQAFAALSKISHQHIIRFERHHFQASYLFSAA